MTDQINQAIMETENRLEQHVDTLHKTRWVAVKSPGEETFYRDSNQLRYRVRDNQLWLHMPGTDDSEDHPMGHVKKLIRDGFTIEPHDGAAFLDRAYFGRSLMSTTVQYLQGKYIYMSRGACANIARISGMTRFMALSGMQEQADWISAALHYYLLYLCPPQQVEFSGYRVPARKAMLYGDDETSFSFMQYRLVDPDVYSEAMSKALDNSEGPDLYGETKDKVHRELRIDEKLEDNIDLRSWVGGSSKHPYLYYSRSINGGLIDHLHLWSDSLFEYLQTMLDSKLVFGDIFSTHT